MRIKKIKMEENPPTSQPTPYDIIVITMDTGEKIRVTDDAIIHFLVDIGEL